MFITNKSDFQDHLIDEDSLYVCKIELPFLIPFFLCEVGHEESTCTTPYLISDLESLHKLVGTNKILNTYLLSPGYMNQSGTWLMNRLKGISRAKYFIDDSSSYIYRFEIEQGSSIYQYIGGLNLNKDALLFESIIRFDGDKIP